MKLNHLSIFVILLLLLSLEVIPQTIPKLRQADKLRIKEAMLIADAYGEQIWRGISETPFVIILITDEHEFLIDHPYPSNDFTLLGKDDVLETDIYVRPQQFNKQFLATFPAVNGVNCVVIGTPENTGLNSTQWIITLLHEHFHQYQFTSPNYQQDALALGISGGDETGMWQLNYPFPYEDSLIVSKYAAYTEQLLKTIEHLDRDTFNEHYKKQQKAHQDFKATLKENDYKYMAFQWYQEGVARYTEYAFLELLEDYKPLEAVKALEDFIPYKAYKEEFTKLHLSNVVKLTLYEHKRLAIYDVGFAQTLVIRKVNPQWSQTYLSDKFDLQLFLK